MVYTVPFCEDFFNCSCRCFKDACSAASAVMKNKKKYKPAVIKMANYAKNFGCSTKK